MNARRLLQRMCKRHGLAFRQVSRLLPLIKRALMSPADVRDRILGMVETNLARRASGAPVDPTVKVHQDLDEEVLRSVARVLHGWTPSPKVLELSKVLPKLFGGELRLEDLTEDLEEDDPDSGEGRARDTGS